MNANKRQYTFFVFLILAVFSCILLFCSAKPAFAADAINDWNISQIVLPNILAGHSLVSANNKIYLIGGANQDDYSQVYSSDANNDGSISAWNFQNNLLQTRYWSSAIQTNNNIYVLGGSTYDGSPHYINTVYLSKIQNDGALSDWQSLNLLPKVSALGAGVSAEGRIYFAGGKSDDSTILDDIYYASINSDGTIGSWTTSSIPLPEPLFSLGMVEYNNNLIITGGVRSNGITSDKVYKASINSDGSLNPWQEQTPLPALNNGAGVIRVGSTLFVIGGGSELGLSAKVYYAHINSDGTINSWQTSSHDLPQTIGSGKVAFANGYLYFTGGFNGSNYVNTVYSAKVNTVLDVPSYKQTDPNWAGITYDSADQWAPVGETTISRWGCALTSAVMLLRYYGITKLPNGNDMDPYHLNEWLTLHSKKYIRNGYINWPTISSLSKLAKSQNPNFAYDMLEFDPLAPATPVQLTTDLKNNHPDILGVNNDSHFVIATGTIDSTFTINDPDSNSTDFTFYGGAFSSLKRFIPANSDGSFIELFVDPGVTITVKDQSNHVVGGQFTENPLKDDIDGEPSGNPLSVYYVEKPDSGKYTVTLSSNTLQNYHLESDIFDVNANDTTGDYTGVLSKGNTESYTIQFDKGNIQNSSVSHVVTVSSLITDIKELNKEKAFHNKGIYSSLLALANVAQKTSKLRNKTAEKQTLNAINMELRLTKNGGITDAGYTLLHDDVTYLLGTL